MNVLQQAGLVQVRKEGKWRFYRLADGDVSEGAGRALAWALRELRDDPTIRRDSRRVARVRGTDLDRLSACYRL
jgi:DNA-binding transcriptional ArsR family regulator